MEIEQLVSEYQLDPTAMPHLARVDALQLYLLAYRIKCVEAACVCQALLHLGLDLDQDLVQVVVPVMSHFLGQHKVLPVESLILNQVFTANM